MAFENKKLRKRPGRVRRAEECRVFLRDHHAGYITWETFEENLRILRGNDMKGDGDESVGPVRAGQGLLAGRLRHGPFGRKLHVPYWASAAPRPATSARGPLGEAGSTARDLGDGSSMSALARHSWRRSRPWACGQASRPPTGYGRASRTSGKPWPESSSSVSTR